MWLLAGAQVSVSRCTSGVTRVTPPAVVGIVLINNLSPGFGICAHLLQHDCAALYLLGKKEEHLAEAEEELRKYGDVAKVKPIQVELEDLQQTDMVAKRLAQQLTRLDALILNAGLGVGPYAESRDGIDTHMAVNVISQHHLTMTLLPLLAKTTNSRLVMYVYPGRKRKIIHTRMHATIPTHTTHSLPFSSYGPFFSFPLVVLSRALHAHPQFPCPPPPSL
jgi:hypothetical protein